MTKHAENVILKKLTKIEQMQKSMLKDWSVVEDFILELTSKQLKKEISTFICWESTCLYC